MDTEETHLDVGIAERKEGLKGSGERDGVDRGVELVGVDSAGGEEVVAVEREGVSEPAARVERGSSERRIAPGRARGFPGC